MSGRRKIQVPDCQLPLVPLSPAPPEKQKKPRTKRIANLEERVTRLEAEVTLIGGQLEREEYPDDYYNDD